VAPAAFAQAATLGRVNVEAKSIWPWLRYRPDLGRLSTFINLKQERSSIMVAFKAVTFKGKKTAAKAFDTMEDYSPEYLWLDDVAVVSRSKHGHLRVHSTWAQDDSAVGAGAGFGAVTAGLIGLVFGPAGAAAGAVFGGSLGALIGAGSNVTFDDPALDDFAASLIPDSSALVLVGEEATLADFVSAVEPFGGKVVETDLNEDDIKALRKDLKYLDD